MKYVYYYQTKDNENRQGEIKARDRADAYTQLRKQGIRPYRVVGDDPFKWRPWAIGAVIAVLAATTLFSVRRLLRSPDAALAGERRQLAGDAVFIARSALDNWSEVFPHVFDRLLAAYAQPGWSSVPPETEDAVKDYPAAMAEPVAITEADREEVRQIKAIVLAMRREVEEYVSGGGTVGDYIATLEDRAQQEIFLRDKAAESFAETPESMRRRAFLNLNLRLKDRNLPPLPDSLLNSLPPSQQGETVRP